MYSNSNSYLGGGNTGRPGVPQYGQLPYSMPQGQQPQNSFNQQAANISAGQIPSQFTGYPPQGIQQNLSTPPQQQPQYTGYPIQNQQSSSSQGYSLQSFQPTPSSSAAISSQQTGQTSSQIAQSFQSNSSPAPSAPKSSAASSKIPKIRLSFLTAEDQAKFEQLFKSAVGNEQSLDGSKAKDLLLLSRLPGSDLMKIWVLSDTTKSGKLLFPEFALAMYLCNLRLVGKDLPHTVPEKIINEVSSMVDIISFGVPDDRPQPPPRSNAPNFDSPSNTGSSPSIQQPQPQTSNVQLLTQLTSQPTGFAAQYIPPQPTGFAAGLGHQQGNFSGPAQNPSAIGYSGPRPPMPPLPSSYSSIVSQPQMGSQPLPLNAQPTGRLGQWGLVNTPSSGLPNIEALQQRMMPQPGREGGYTTAGLAGSATIPWAVTKDEKKIYDQLFKAWDGLNKGFIGGDVAIEVMGQSGLPKSDLERIWTLSDPGNKGKLDMDEFAVAMHLIYRKLNGYPVPNQLPPELVPPSTRNFADSIGTVKSLLSQDAETRKSSGSFLQPQRTGVSYLKDHSFRSDSNGITQRRKDATVFRNNDDDVGYKSSARRRLASGGRTPSPTQSTSPATDKMNDNLSLEQLRKKIKEKQVLLDALDFKEENDIEEDDALDRKDRRDAEELFRRIRRIQESIDSQPNASFRDVDSGAERRNLKRQLDRLSDRLPELASNVRKTERNISDAKLELFRLKDARAHPGGASTMVGTGPGGAVTEADRLKARAKAMMQQRSAALTGKAIPAGTDDGEAASRRLEQENSRIKSEKETNERMIKDVEDSVQEFSRRLADGLMEGSEDSTREHERRRWEDGLGVEEEVRDFIFDLQRSSRSSKLRIEESSRGRNDDLAQESTRRDSSRDLTPTRDTRATSSSEVSRPSISSAGTYSSYKTAEDRAAFIKQKAEQRMAERLAELGIKPATKPGESSQQREQREAHERQERVRQAEAEDRKRDEERRRRLADEQPGPPSVNLGAKKPPPPPSRKTRADNSSVRVEASRKADEAASKVEAEQKEKEGLAELQRAQEAELKEKERQAKEQQAQEAQQKEKERSIKNQQEAQAAKIKDAENETIRQEDELAKEREAAQARLKALEEQVRQGKIKKQEEKRKRQAAEKEAKEKEARLAAQRAELEAAREKERQLQLQLESLNDEDSSDDEGPQEITPLETTPTNSQVLSREGSTQLDPASSAAREPVNEPPTADSHSAAPPISGPSSYGESRNPFFKKLNQPNEVQSSSTSSSTSLLATPVANEMSTNPFHRLTQQDNAARPQIQPSSVSPPAPPTSQSPNSGQRPSRVRPEDDQWSVVDSTGDSSSDDEPDRTIVGSAKHLASILFGSLAPARPQSAGGGDNERFKTPVDSPSTPSAAPTIPSANLSPQPAPIPVQSSTSSYDNGAPAAPAAPPPPPPPMPPGMEAAFGSAPPAPPPPPPPSLPPPGADSGRQGLLGEIVRGKGLKKVETRDRSQASVAGRVLG